MAERKKKASNKPVKTASDLPVWRIRLLWGIIALVSLLGLLSLWSSDNSLDSDIRYLFGDNNGITAIFSNAVSDLENPIGIFGVLVSYCLIGLFGKLFSILTMAILLGVSLHGFL